MAGVIVIDQAGLIGAAHSTPKLIFGWADDTGTLHACTNAAMFRG